MLRSSWTRIAGGALALALVGCRRPGPPDLNYEKAAGLYQRLYVQEFDEAYGDPRMEEVVALLKKVNPRSIDAPSAQALIGMIERRREQLAKVRAERDKLVKAAAEVVSTPSTIDPAAVLARPDAGTPQDPFGPGATVAEINTASGGCLVAGEQFRENVTNRTGTVYRLAPSPACAQKLPGFVAQVVMVEGGVIYRRVPESQVQVPPPAVASDGSVARLTAPRRPAEATGAASPDAGSSY